MIGFIGTSVIFSLLIALKYSAIADLNNFQFTVAHALEFSFSTNRLLATDLNEETSTSNHSLLLRPNLYSINLHTSLRTRSILVLVLLAAEPAWTLLS
jgi:hypothetical protein